MKFSPETNFDASICSGCWICSRVCPANSIIPGKENLPEFHSDSCIGCGHCAAYCPQDAFHLGGSLERTCPVDSSSFLKLLEKRRSVRIFSEQEPSEKEIRKLLLSTGFSPTGRNACGIVVRVVLGRERVSRLLNPIKKIFRLPGFSGIAHFAGALTGLKNYVSRFISGEDIIFRNSPAVIWFFAPRSNVTGRSDGVIAASITMLYAETLGMCTFWNGFAEKLYPLFPSWHIRSIRGMRLCAVLCVGFPEIVSRSLPPRKFRIIV